MANQRSDKSSRNAFVSLVVFNDPHVRLLPFGPLLALLGSGALPIIFNVSREKRFEKSNIGPQLRDLLARNIVAVLMDRPRTRFERAQKLEQCG